MISPYAGTAVDETSVRGIGVPPVFCELTRWLINNVQLLRAIPTLEELGLSLGFHESRHPANTRLASDWSPILCSAASTPSRWNR
jgi:hypothetical protein